MAASPPGISSLQENGRYININEAVAIPAEDPRAALLLADPHLEGEGDAASDEAGFFQSIKPVAWPEWIQDPSYPPPPLRVTDGVRITHINHATLLLQVDGLNILTDPIWSERASPLSWIGPKRVRAPGLALPELPPIDAILISHNHYDHLDIPTLKELHARFAPVVIAGLGNRPSLESAGVHPVVELDWWQAYDLGGLAIRFVPAQHGSARGAFDRNRTLWGGFVLESTGAGNIYFAGDTGLGPFASHIKQRYTDISLALLPIGHYLPRHMMRQVHMSPVDAVKLHLYLEADISIGMHFGTFHGIGAHNAEGVVQHETDLASALQRFQVAPAGFLTLGFGEGQLFFPPPLHGD